jgi:hypothetical protein
MYFGSEPQAVLGMKRVAIIGALVIIVLVLIYAMILVLNAHGGDASPVSARPFPPA